MKIGIGYLPGDLYWMSVNVATYNNTVTFRQAAAVLQRILGAGEDLERYSMHHIISMARHENRTE